MATKTSTWDLGGLTPMGLISRVRKRTGADEVTARAAQLSYYFLLALFPLMLFLISVLGLVASGNAELQKSLFEMLGRVMPASAGGLVQQTVTEVTKSAGGGKVLFGVIGALWAASAGMVALTETLNIAYGVEETRPWWKKRLLAVGLTVGISVLIIAAMTLALYGGKIAELISSHAGLGDVFVIAWKVLQWPVLLAFVFASFALIYYFAPDLKDRKWHWITPGSAVGLTLWLVASFGLKTYLSFSNTYSKTYGSLGAVIILMLWFYLTGAAILIGAEVNSVITEAQGTAEKQLEKQKRIERQLQHLKAA